MFKFLAVIAAAVASASAYSMAEYDMLFTGYKSAFGVTFTAEEEAMRRAVFQVNVDKIAAHNAAGHSWDMSINEFAHMTPAEFAAGRIGGYVPKTLRGKRNEVSMDTVSIPSSVDWAKKGKVTAVKNQGQCGSCWAFSTTGSTESINAINGNALTSLSEQQLMDCSTSYGNQGCNGGLMDNAFKYIIANGGLCSEASYPYTAHDGICKTDCTKVVSIKSYTDVPTNDASQFKAAIAQQPVSIAIEADQTSFQFYSGGVLTKTCGSNLDHGVLAVGYGTMSGQGYYKVKNSWGASWGMSGYVLLSDDSSLNGGAGQCGILSDPSWPSQ